MSDTTADIAVADHPGAAPEGSPTARTYPHIEHDINPENLRATGNSRIVDDIRATRPDLVASIAEHGVDPRVSVINVVPDPDGVLRVLVGFSRTAAAVAVRQQENPSLTVDVLVHAPGTTRRDQLIAQGVENLHRQGYTQPEEASLYEQLALEGVDEDAIARALSRPVEQVRAGRAVVASPRTQAASQELPEADLLTLAALAEFDDDEQAHAELVELLDTRPRHFDHAVSRLRRQRNQQNHQLAEEARLIERGFTVLDSRYGLPEGVEQLDRLCAGDDPTPLDPALHATCPGRAAHVFVDTALAVEITEFCLDYAEHGHQSIAAVNVSAAEQQLREQGVKLADPELDTVAALHHLHPAGDPERTLTSEQHASCPGHAAYVDNNGYSTTARVHFVCDDYTAHGHVLRAARSSCPAPKSSAYLTGERKRAGKNNEAWRNAKADRREWLANFFAGWRKRKATELPARVHHWLALAVVLGNDYLAEAAPAHRYARGLLRLGEPKDTDRDSNPIAVLLRKKTTTEVQAIMIRLAEVIGACEEHWDRAYTDKNADSSWRSPTADSRFYFELLAALDYPLRPVEQLINNPRADAAQWPHLATNDNTPSSATAESTDPAATERSSTTQT